MNPAWLRGGGVPGDAVRWRPRAAGRWQLGTVVSERDGRWDPHRPRRLAGASPGFVAGYSKTPLAAKLGIKEGTTVALVSSPPDLVVVVPPGVTVKRQARGRADVVVAFFTRRARLEERVEILSAMIFPAGGLWIGWPKRASGVRTDITD